MMVKGMHGCTCNSLEWADGILQVFDDGKIEMLKADRHCNVTAAAHNQGHCSQPLLNTVHVPLCAIDGPLCVRTMNRPLLSSRREYSCPETH